MIIKFKDDYPKIHSSCFIAENSTIIGKVKIDEGSSIFFNVVLRGDVEEIAIGKYTNIQDNCTVHTDINYPAKIGDEVTVGHNCIIHGCNIGNNCIIGMGSIILNGAEIGENCIIGAGSLVTQNYKIPPNTLCFGSPAKIIRELTKDEIYQIKKYAMHYVETAKIYK
ncbi:gamma carbonic anhydrase family protein [Caloramator sp. E03]|uniref:gamma carbonic anhydrase family protein n=1 Tax=Caloramator sp. E03 TaxID=2576307 RepID=UPI00110FF8C9|nr:gamma carbonic anhydrase family protein [Caloramator sp. E03]QCX34247.1 gamma carbonic anhydrase family protein [Caloramator sp. E03]